MNLYHARIVGSTRESEPKPAGASPPISIRQNSILKNAQKRLVKCKKPDENASAKIFCRIAKFDFLTIEH